MLLLIMGLIAGYYLGITHPEYAERAGNWRESLPFLKTKDSTSTRETTTDSLSTGTDSTSVVSTVAVLSADCMSTEDFQQSLMRISKNIEARKFAYRRELGQDCSGIFHKIKDSVEIWASSNCSQVFSYPDFETTRSSRHIADWYYRNDNLVFVEDPMTSRNLIKPGSVMFYAKPGKKYSGLTIEMLTASDNNYNSAQAAIMHIGVVVDVTRDPEGNVIQYTLMHGRNERYPASMTDFHKEVQSRSNPNLPKFGNWSQQWVAIAEVATLK